MAEAPVRAVKLLLIRVEDEVEDEARGQKTGAVVEGASDRAGKFTC